MTVMEALQKTEDLLALIQQETGKTGVELDADLDSLGIDSLDFVSLMQAIEEKFKVEIPVESYGQITTVRDIRERI